MKRKLKGIAGIVVCLFLLCSVLVVTAFAEKETERQNNGVEIATPSEPEEIELPSKPEDNGQSEEEEETGKPEEVDEEFTEKQVILGNRMVRVASPSDAIPVEDVKWDENERGWATWNSSQLSDEEWELVRGVGVYIYKDGELIGAGTYDNPEERCRADVRYHFKEEGTYTFRAIYKMGNNIELPDYDEWEVSDEDEYTLTAKKMPSPTGLRWNSDGSVEWEAVPGDDTMYVLELYKKNTDTGEYECIERGGLSRRTSTERFIRDMKKGEIYKFKVVVLGDLVEYANSDASEYSPEFYMGSVSEQANNIIGEMNKGDIRSNIENANLSSVEKGSLKLAVQADVDVAQSYAQLEEKYKSAAEKHDLNISTGESGVNTDKVSVIGAIMNGATGIKFDKPRQEVLTDVDVINYRKRTAVNISLEGGVSGEMKLPVLITMAVPDGIEPEYLTIIHMKHDGTKEIILPRVNDDGTVSFAVTDFSTFIFVDSTSNKPTTGGSSSSGSVRTGTKKNPLETAGTWILDEHGWWFKKLNGTYPVSQWVMNGGLWYRFDEKGYMLTGWFTDIDGKKYYLNPISDGTRGSMKTGWQLIDGKWYYFNNISNGTRGAMLTDTTTPDNYRVGMDGVWVES